MLIAAGEKTVDPSHGLFEIPWRNVLEISTPQRADDVGKFHGQFALTSQFRRQIDVLDEIFLAKIKGEKSRAGEALNDAVHVTGIAEISKPRHSWTATPADGT